MKSKAMVLLLAAIFCTSMLFAPGGSIVTTQADNTIVAPSAQEQFVEKYAERLLDDVAAGEVMDPALREFMESGYLAEDIVTTSDNSIKVVIFLSPTADYNAVKQVVDVNWRMDLKAMQVISTTVDSALDLKKLEAIDGVSYISADTYLTKTEIDIAIPEMYAINDVVGRYGPAAADYDGSGVVVALDDTGVDFSLPDMKDAIYIDDDGYPGDFDPSGWGITEMYLANNTAVDNVTAWLEDGNLLTYELGGKTYLNVTGWDPVTNNNGGHRDLMGLYYPTGTVGFIGLYEYFWGINNASEFVENEMWMDWEIPAAGADNYTFGWSFQQRTDSYAKLFTASMIYEGELVIDWNSTEAWTKMWNYAFWDESIDLNVTDDRDYITGMMDWNFTDDYDNGDKYFVGGAATADDIVLGVDFDGDTVDDMGIGSLTWVYDGFGYLSTGVGDDFFCGISDDNMAWAAMFNSEGAHGTWTATAVGSRGVYEHPNIFDDGRTGNMTLPGIANGSSVIAVKGLTSGDDLGAQFWAAGFHLGADGNFSISAEGTAHKADIISNSWGYVNGAYLTLTYLTMAWELMSVPGIIDSTYNGTLFLVSAGNSGPDYITNGAPDSAFSVISVGGTSVTHAYDDLYEDGQLQLNQEAWFTSNGPSFLGNIKPDIVAPAIFGMSPMPFHNVWLDIDDSALWWSGTSLACPIAAGGVAIILEALKDTHGADWYDPQILKDVVLSTAMDIGVDPAIQGHGLIDIEAAVDAVVNDGGYAFQSASLDNYLDIIGDAWDYWIPDWAPFGVWFDEMLNESKTGLESSSIFFGNVYQGGTYQVNLSVYDPFDSSTYGVSDFTITPQYYAMAEQFSYDVDLRAHNDTNLYYTYRTDVVNITSLLSTAEFNSFMDATYVTINANSEGGDMRVWDFAENNYGGSLGDVNATAGVTNYWYNETYPGDYIQWVSRDSSNCNNLIARLSNGGTGDVGDLFPNTPVIYLADATANETYGAEVTLTFTIWADVSDTTITTSDVDSMINVTLEVPADAEMGIHQGRLTFDDGSIYHEVPYSYMVVFEVDAAADTGMVLIDTFGDELTPYESGAISPSFDAGAGIKMDGGGHRTFVLDIADQFPTYNATILVLKAEWQNTGTVVDMYLRHTTYHQITSTDDGWGGPYDPTPTSALKNTIVWDAGDLINGTYYLEISVHVFDGADAYENITITLYTYASLATGVIDPTWVSRTSTTPLAFANQSILVGDHVEISNTWSLTTPTNLPEYAITNTKLAFLSGLYYLNSGTMADPGSWDEWPIPLSETDHYVWESVEGIYAGDDVYVGVDSPGGDISFDVYEWADDNSDGLVDLDEIGATPFISVDDGGGGLESGSFTAANDMDIAIRVFGWLWAYHAGDTYTIVVDTRVSIDVNSVDETVVYDTYDLEKNATMTVQYTAWTNTDVVFVYLLGEVRFENFFTPVVTVTAPATGSTSTGDVVITWTVTDANDDDEFFFEVLLSSDGGDTFQLLAKNITGLTYTWDSSGFLIKSTYVIMVRVFDNDAVENPTAISTEAYWPGLTDFDVSGEFTAGDVEQTEPEPTPTPTPPGLLDNPETLLWIGLIGGIGIGVVVILILFLVKKK